MKQPQFKISLWSKLTMPFTKHYIAQVEKHFSSMTEAEQVLAKAELAFMKTGVNVYENVDRFLVDHRYWLRMRENVQKEIATARSYFESCEISKQECVFYRNVEKDFWKLAYIVETSYS